jgi:hypothetical protein
MLSEPALQIVRRTTPLKSRSTPQWELSMSMGRFLVVVRGSTLIPLPGRGGLLSRPIRGDIFGRPIARLMQLFPDFVVII